jgi:gamma-glutamyl-gamma-aminobutyrate hydrolase PuuD
MAGFTPILVPLEADPNKIAEIADGLLLAGGQDICPIHYGFSNTASMGVDPEKDTAERELLYAFTARNKRVFGICRGMQLIFREFMRELELASDPAIKYFDYIENIGGHTQTSSLRAQRGIPSHYVKANMGRLLSIGKDTLPERLPVNSMHHQACIFNHGQLAVDKMNLKKGEKVIRNIQEPSATLVKTSIGDLQALAWSLRSVDFPKNEKDYKEYWSIMEAFQFTTINGEKLLAVQWHPEELRTVDLFRNFFLENTKNNTAVQ